VIKIYNIKTAYIINSGERVSNYDHGYNSYMINQTTEVLYDEGDFRKRYKQLVRQGFDVEYFSGTVQKGEFTD